MVLVTLSLSTDRVAWSSEKARTTKALFDFQNSVSSLNSFCDQNMVFATSYLQHRGYF